MQTQPLTTPYLKTLLLWNFRERTFVHEVGVEQGNLNSGDFYKIYAKSLSQMAQESNLGVELARDIVVSRFCQADDILHLSNNLYSLQNLLQLSLYYCSKYNVELSPEVTKLQVITQKRLFKEVEYLKEFSPVQINNIKLKFHDSAEHVGIIHAVSGNLQNLVSRISPQKKAVDAVLQNLLAKHHRANPAAYLKVEEIYRTSVLLSSLGPLALRKTEQNLINHHRLETLRSMLRLLPNTPHPSNYFLAGCLP